MTPTTMEALGLVLYGAGLLGLIWYLEHHAGPEPQGTLRAGRRIRR